jgi:HSP20 family protein
MRRNDEFLPARRDPSRGLAAGRDDPAWGSPAAFSASPWQLMRRMHEDVDRLFGQFFGGAGPGGMMPAALGQLGQWAPSMDVSESDREWRIEAELPGVRKDDVNVEVRDHHLVLRAEMRQETPEGEGDPAERQYHRRERRYGRFDRVFPLPDNVDEAQIRCTFRDGVLTIHLPKTEKARQQGRRIPVGEEAAQPLAGQAAPAVEAGTSDGETAAGNGRKQAAKGSRKTNAKPATGGRAKS